MSRIVTARQVGMMTAHGVNNTNTMIFTSNMTPDKWNDYFDEGSSLLCALDRIFDNAKVIMIKGESYRGRKRETCAIETGTKASVSRR